MNTGILITARLGSTRLKKKHLIEVNHRPILYYQIQRIIKGFEKELGLNNVKIIIATSDEPENREFEKFSTEGVAVYYGSLSNIPFRHLGSAKTFSLDNIVAIDGDDILCSVTGMRAVYTALTKGDRYVKTSNLPFGMNSFGYTTDYLESSLSNHLNDILETGWGRIFNSQDLVDLSIPFSIQNNLLRFTLDYQDDLEFFKVIIEAFGDKIISVSDEEIVSFVMANKVYKANELISKEYWGNFYKNLEEEKQSSARS